MKDTIEIDLDQQTDKSDVMDAITKQGYRAYYFGNMYLSSIQQGIQAAHVTSEFWNKYNQFENGYDCLLTWSMYHKTMVLLNGGYQSELELIYSELERLCTELGFPFAKFHEEKDSLNGALTSVGVILPEEVYAFSGATESDRVIKQSEFDPTKRLDGTEIILSDIDFAYWEIRSLLSRYGLAK